MISHVFVGVSDFDRALSFYDPLMAVLGMRVRFCDRSRPWAGWESSPGQRPLFIIGAPYDRRPHERGNGQMVALVARSRDAVARAYATALAHGGTAEGAPGLRPEYHEHYYGAYLRDTEGNKIGLVCHAPALPAAISGINHVTLAVSDLERSFAFYTTVLGLRPKARWARGAYLTAGPDWICLSLDDRARSAPHLDYTHLALTVEAASFPACAAAVGAHGAVIWKENASDGESLYFLDPDGHKLEIHAGDLWSRLASLKLDPYEGLQLFD